MPKKKKEEEEREGSVAKKAPPEVSRSSKKPQLVKGMKDILPADQAYWDRFRALIQRQTSEYGFQRLDPPVLEDLSLYTHGVGKATDIVEKEMYSFVDQGGQNLAVRPEFTAGMCRAYVEHGMISEPQPVKLFTVGPLFRHDKPQEGRLRQHHQYNCEIIGEGKASVDAQLILMAHKFYSQLGIQPLLHINSIGCAACRAPYREVLTEYYKSKKNQLCEDCKRRLGKNTLRLLDCKAEECQAVKEKSPKMDEYWCEACREHFTAVIEFVTEFEIPHEYDPHLVRGMDYYTRTVFEFVYPFGQGESAKELSIGGGGRYDNLIELFGGQSTPACGFGIGLERVLMCIKDLEQQGIIEKVAPAYAPVIFFAQLGDKAKRKAMLMYEDLLAEGYKLAEGFTKDSLKAQLEMANKLGVSFTLILGEKELLDGTIIIRNMEGGEQEVIDVKKLIPVLQKKLGHDSVTADA